jgi:hypothetical protein
MTHTIRVVTPLCALDVELADFVADVTVNWHPASGNGWDEPREPAFAELVGVIQVSGPYIPPRGLSWWADRWVAANQGAIERDILDSVVGF